MTRRTWAAAAMAVAGLIASPAFSQNFVVNPSFETGDVTGWTGTGGCDFAAYNAGGVTPLAGGWTAPAPSDGVFVMLSDAGAPGTCTLFQDIVLPPNRTYKLGFAAGYNYTNFGAPTAAGCEADISITTTGGVPIATFYKRTGGTTDPFARRGSFTLPDTVAGTTVRLIMTMNSCADGPVGIVADDFSLVVFQAIPLLSPWAAALMAILMVGAGIAMTRRPEGVVRR